ncbi:FAD-dependent oxidoreductase [Paenibacillus sp. TAB 01]|uniref:FAD-dependent oxidoreductase n=1 Tax=Paenibacillus sp. TAB 01 TaxID=3368988 RepID=UPI00375160E8
MRTAYDVIIAGAGSMGMSAGYYLASQGAEVLLLDAFNPPHTFGSHHGDTRLLRHAYTGSRTYTEMALRADKLWTELEQAAGEPLIVRSGVLNIGTPDSSLLAAKLERSNEYGIELETLSSADMGNRWPGLTLRDSYTGMFEKRAGYLLSEACVSACRRLAEAQNAVVRPFTPLRRLEAERGDVRAHTGPGRLYRQSRSAQSRRLVRRHRTASEATDSRLPQGGGLV